MRKSRKSAQQSVKSVDLTVFSLLCTLFVPKLKQYNIHVNAVADGKEEGETLLRDDGTAVELQTHCQL